MSRKLKDPEVIEELKRLATESGGLLSPQYVVNSAQRASSPLHHYFDWDNGEAATKWRIHQARMLINVCVEMIGNAGDPQEMRVFVSLRDDRDETRGYRTLVTVMEVPPLRNQLLQDALDEMQFFRQKYASLMELADVFSAMRTTGKKLRSHVARETATRATAG